MTLEDELARFAAQQQQVLAGYAEIAAILWAYRTNLVLIGFSHDEAFELTRDFHEELLTRQQAVEEDDGD